MQESRIFGLVALCMLPWAVLGCPCGSFGGFGRLLERLGLLLQCLWATSGRLGVHLGCLGSISGHHRIGFGAPVWNVLMQQVSHFSAY